MSEAKEFLLIKLNKSKRGVSGIISGIFMVSVTILCFNLLVWQMIQADVYAGILRERERLEWERRNERIEITAIGSSTTQLTFNVTNLGPVAAHLVGIWLTRTDVSPRTTSYKAIDDWVAPGGVKNVTGPSIVPGSTCFFRVITEKGNSVSPAQAITTYGQPGEAQLVPFTLAFIPGSFQYQCQGTASWTPAWRIENGKDKDYAVFRLNVTNTANKDVNVRVDSVLDFGETWQQTSRLNFIQNSYYIVASGSTTGHLISFTSQTIQAGKSAYVYFGATEVGGNNNQDMPTGERWYVLVALFYQYVGESTVYGATVAVIAVQIVS